MHDLILSRRNGEAQQRLLQAAETLARYFELDPALVEALKPNTKDTAVRALKEREAVADLLEALEAGLGFLPAPMPESPVTTVTDTINNQVEEAGTPGIPAETTSTPTEPVLPEDLPAPVLDEPAIDEEPKSSKKKTKKK
jgi:hypothetical protein